MRQALTDLCAVLQEQTDLLKNMLELAKDKQRVIINNESDKLEDIIRTEFKQLSKLGNIEKKRLGQMMGIAADMGIAEEELTLSKIAEMAEDDEREVVKKIQAELTSLIDEHTTVNNENRKLIEAHVEFSKVMLELMVGVEDPLNNMYGGDGRAAPDVAKKTSIFDGHA